MQPAISSMTAPTLVLSGGAMFSTPILVTLDAPKPKRAAQFVEHIRWLVVTHEVPARLKRRKARR